MNQVLDMHHKLMRKVLLQHGGYESDTEGDSFIVAFASPWDALAFAQVRGPGPVRSSLQPCSAGPSHQPITLHCEVHRAREQDVQRGLIKLPWPDELLQCEAARPLWAQVGGSCAWGAACRAVQNFGETSAIIVHPVDPHQCANAEGQV